MKRIYDFDMKTLYILINFEETMLRRIEDILISPFQSWNLVLHNLDGLWVADQWVNLVLVQRVRVSSYLLRTVTYAHIYYE